MIGKIRAAWHVIVEEKGRIINLPNGITTLRVISVYYICSYLQQELIFWATWLFCFAAITDRFDGYIARKYNQETKVGEFFDQLADKILVLAVLWVMYKVDHIDLWPWIIPTIFIREIIIGLGRALIADTKIALVVSVNKLGKYKAGAQYIGIPWTMLEWPYFNWIMAVVAILTVISGAVYVFNFFTVLYKDYIRKLILSLINNKK